MKTKTLALVVILGTSGIYLAQSQLVIQVQPQDQTNIVGTIATFSVTATDTLLLSYQWAFGSPPVNLTGMTNANLALPSVQFTNQGPYQVVVSDSQGSVTSSIANLYVVPVPVLQFSAGLYTVAESAGSVILGVQRTGWPAAALSVDYATADGSAKNGSKYSAVSGRLMFLPGETNHTIEVPILNEGFAEGTQFFRVILSNPGGGAFLGGRAHVSVLITDNDSGIQFQLPTNSVSEDAGQIVLRVVRDDDGMLPMSVQVATTDLSAISGVDYVGVTNTLEFAPQERVKLIPVSILNNTLKQPNRLFRATLANPVGGSLGSQITATVTIVDNDQGFQFQSPSYTVTQDAGVVQLGVSRGTDDTNSTVSVEFFTTDATALSGVDYLGATNALVFGPGVKLKLVRIPLLSQRLATTGFRAGLRNPSSGAALGAPSSVRVTILNSNPGVGFEARSYANGWSDAGGLTVTVLRGNATALGPFTVDYATSDLTAQAGVDYQAIAGTLPFEQNETVKSLTIPILRSRATPGSRTFRVNLTNPTGGLQLGLTSTLAYIEGSYVTVAPPFDAALDTRLEEGTQLFSWAGGGMLQRADTPLGPWQKLTSATSPYAAQPFVPTGFYRVARPKPVEVYVPSSYDGKTSLPLVILIHGYTWNGDMMENWMHFQPLAESRGFFYCHPTTTAVDGSGGTFWNGTDACCDFWSTANDDAGFLRALIQEISGQLRVDQKRIYLVGHSNGGYLSYHTACESADLIAAIVSVAGSTFLDSSRCQPAEPVNILQIHGTADQAQFYDGGANTQTNGFPGNLPPFPSATQSVQTWATYNGASGRQTDPGPTLDLTTDVAGLDTVVTRYTNAPPGGAVELWTILGGTHWPNLTTQFAPSVIDWLFAHPKP
jgi:polyhydroxybutyrate depolymerase